MQVGLGLATLYYMGTQLLLPQMGTVPLIFGLYLLWSNGWCIKMALGMEVGLRKATLC